MASTNDVVSQIVDNLFLSDPELDTSIGTPLRKIIDAFATQISQATTDSYLIDYQYDVDSKTGGDLDDFCANFGLSRIVGTRATGVLTFSRSTAIAATQAVVIGPGTQAVTGSIPAQTFQTTVSTTMDVGVVSVDIPAQSLESGPDGNIIANTPLQLASTLVGVSAVSNSANFVGGTIDETDDQFRARFKATVFRNLAGTDQMYRGIALQTLANEDAGSFGVAQVNILGATVHNVEQIQIAFGIATASLQTAAYFVPSSVYITDDNGTVYTLRNQYTISVNNTTTPATMTINSVGAAAGMPDGIYNLIYDYVPIVSRNDPFNTRWGQGVVNNRVDVIVNGQVSAAGVQSAVYTSSIQFNNTTGDPLLRTKFVDPSGNHPAAGDTFVPLGFGPILSLPSSLTLNGNTYLIGFNYDIIHQDDAFGYAPNSPCGIWFKTTINDPNPTNNTVFSVGNGYTYNTVPSDVMNNLANWRLLGTDVQIHAGKEALLSFNFAIVYESGVNSTTVQTNINTALDAYLKRLGFSAAVQVSDVIQQVHNISGVDNVRLLNSSDNPTFYGIQQVQSNGNVIQTFNVSGRPTDVYFDERTYPLFFSSRFTTKARNTFRA